MDQARLLERLHQAFQMESAERLAVIQSRLVTLEKMDDPAARHALVEEVFREAHSLKGAARAVQLRGIETLCQAMEGVLGTVKDGRRHLTPALFDALHDATRYLGRMFPGAQADLVPAAHQLADLVERLTLEDAPGGFSRDVAKGAASPLPEEAGASTTAGCENTTAAPLATEPPAPMVADSASPCPACSPAPGFLLEQGTPSGQMESPVQLSVPSLPTVRVPTQKLDDLLLRAEEMIAMKMVWDEQIRALAGLARSFDPWRKRGSGSRGGTENDDFLLLNHDFVCGMERRIKELARGARGSQRQFDRLVDDLLDRVKSVIMVPAATILETFHGMVREIAREQRKEVSLITLGNEVEVDRRILEEMKTPLIHLLRNAVDHGLESVKERLEVGKRATGEIFLQVSQVEGNQVEVRLRDDGRGINLPALRERLAALGTFSAEEVARWPDQQVREWIFHSGISTAAKVTELSGRGLGMAIVQETVGRLGGRLTLKEPATGGTEIVIHLPISLSTFRGVQVRVGERLFILPSDRVEGVLKVPLAQVQTLENCPTISHGGAPLSLVDLATVLGLTAKPPGAALTVVVLAWRSVRIAFRVDRVVEEREILVKGLGKHLKRVKYVSGATILGSGRVVPILNVADLMAGAVGEGSAAWGVGSREMELSTRRRAILVVEDSLTSRMMMKNILEVAGYEVHTAMDGEDGLKKLREQAVDLVVADVEMPLMNGFEMTERIRADAALAHLPLILVTSLSSRQDRERGIHAGANAYMVKAEFDQGNLLEIIEGLL
ncbi:MAG: response regulator [Magnetococcales bacterium]|nr:response regulator [Magnetococcales bacterium]